MTFLTNLEIQIRRIYLITENVNFQEALKNRIKRSALKIILRIKLTPFAANHYCLDYLNRKLNLTQTSTVVETATTPICDLNQRVAKNQMTIALIDSRKLIPSSSEHDDERRQIRSRLTKILRNDHEQRWGTEARQKRQLLQVPPDIFSE